MRKRMLRFCLTEFTDTIQGQSVVSVSLVTGSDKTKGKVQTPFDTKDFTTPAAESTREGDLKLTPYYEHKKLREQNQYQVGKEILNETIDEEAKVILLEVQKAMEEKFRAEQEAIQLKLQEKLQREQEELAHKQPEELLPKEQQQRIELEKEKALLEEQQKKTQELKDRLTSENTEDKAKIESDIEKAKIRWKDINKDF